MKVIGGIAAMRARLQRRPQTHGQVAKFDAVLREHPEAVVIECADERSGNRFGKELRRRGMCARLGGARQPLWYQAWATWAPKDLAEAHAHRENRPADKHA